MNCTVCHTELPPEARACPNCGTMVSSSNTSYNAGTIVSSQNKSPQPQPSQPSTSYGSDPYLTSSQYNPPPLPSQYNPPPPPYNKPIQGGYSSSPNQAPIYEPRQPGPAYVPPYPPISPVPPRSTRNKKIWLIVGIGLLIVVLLTGGSIYIVRTLINQNSINQVATATPDSTQNPYPPKTGKLVLNDPMTDNSQGNKWDETVIHDTGNPTCGFKSGGYHITSSSTVGEEVLCEPEAQNLYFSNIAFEANFKIVNGESAGVALRIDQTTTSGYLFTIDINGNYHLYIIDWRLTNSSDRDQEIGKGGSSDSINKGLNASNLLAIVANGKAISVYVNGSFLESVQDATYSNGQIAVYGGGSGLLDVSVANARAWQL